jgi:hypothetical protein
MAITSLQKVSTPVRWIARVASLLIAILFLIIVIINAVQIVPYVTRLHGAINFNMIVTIVPGILVLAGYALSWRREWIGGILFILAAFAISLESLNRWLAISPISNQNVVTYIFKGWVVLGLPLLVTGILFLVVSWLTRKERQLV